MFNIIIVTIYYYYINTPNLLNIPECSTVQHLCKVGTRSLWETGILECQNSTTIEPTVYKFAVMPARSLCVPNFIFKNR